MGKTCLSLLALATALAAIPAAAQKLPVEGTRQNTNPLNPTGAGRCAPIHLNTANIQPGPDTSTGQIDNPGIPSSTQSDCITSAPPSPVTDGRFIDTFRGSDTISGVLNANLTRAATAGVFNATALGGPGAIAADPEPSVALGTAAVATGFNAIAIGTGSSASAFSAIAIGPNTSASDLQAIAIGIRSQASQLDSIGIGTLTQSTGERAIAIGSVTSASGTNGIALGYAGSATGNSSIAIGAEAVGAADNATALGTNAAAQGTNSTAVGANATASALTSSAYGASARASGIASSALGHNTVASGLASTATGVSARATGTGATAVGRLSAATADGASAFGAGASAGFANSTAIGTGAVTTAANQVTVGGTGSSVRVGDIAASTAAQSGPVGLVTADASGVLGRNTTIIPGLQNQIDSLFDLRRVDRTEWRAGIAGAVAMGQAPMPSASGRTSYVLNGGTFRGEWAVGGSFMHRLDLGGEKTPFAIGGGFAVAGRGNNSFRVGVAGEF